MMFFRNEIDRQHALLSVISRFEKGNYSLTNIWEGYPDTAHIELFTKFLFNLGLIYIKNGEYHLSEQGKVSFSYILQMARDLEFKNNSTHVWRLL